MHWLIAEDALRDRHGHWFEYVSTFHRGLRALGDAVTVLSDREAESFVCEQLNTIPILPHSIWHRMSDGAGPLRRYARVPLHAWQTYRAMQRFFRHPTAHFSPWSAKLLHGTDLRGAALRPLQPVECKATSLGRPPSSSARGVRSYSAGSPPDLRSPISDLGPFDLLFIPTVLVHHLLGWVWLIKRVLHDTPTRVLLFFPNAPIRFDPATRKSAWLPSPTSRLFARLIRSLSGEVRARRVILGAETQPMRDALTRLTGVPFTYLPHPVTPIVRSSTLNPQPSTFLFGSYGPARHEKGSDVLQAAVRSYLASTPSANVRFALQWLEDFNDDQGRRVTRDAALKRDGRVEFITRLFRNGEYAEWLERTHALVLPYRVSSYGLRVSRVVIEASVNGIPVVATRGTTLAAQASEYSALVECEDGDSASLSAAIGGMETRFEQLRERARARMMNAQRHFSVANFRELLCAG